jgi:predicted transcriptional regulator of viral defense system
MKNLIAKLYQAKNTVFTVKDLAIIWQETDRNNLKAKVAYYVKRGILIRLLRGIFSKDRNYDPKELATSIYKPSYISFETVLREAGIIFQHYDTIFVAGPWPKEMNVDKFKFTFRKLKNEVLYNPEGIEKCGNYNIASRERAFLDMIYLFPEYYFDNLRNLDWKKCFELVKIYKNKRLGERLEKYKKQVESS